MLSCARIDSELFFAFVFISLSEAFLFSFVVQLCEWALFVSVILSVKVQVESFSLKKNMIMINSWDFCAHTIFSRRNCFHIVISNNNLNETFLAVYCFYFAHSHCLLIFPYCLLLVFVLASNNYFLTFYARFHSS